MLFCLHDGATDLAETVATACASPRVVGLRTCIIPRLAIIIGVLTLDTVQEPALKAEADFTDEQTTGMRLAKDEDDVELADDKVKFPYDLEPVKLESLRILADLISLSPAPRTAQTAPGR